MMDDISELNQIDEIEGRIYGLYVIVEEHLADTNKKSKTFVKNGLLGVIDRLRQLRKGMINKWNQ